MKRKEFFQLVQPLIPKLYRFAYSLIPDDLQAEQLVIDGINAYLLKEKRAILRKEIKTNEKKEMQSFRKLYLKGILKYVSDIGLRRASQLGELSRMTLPSGNKSFYNLEPRVRIVLYLRYDAQFSVEDIEDIVQIPRYEVIEKLHNGRYLLLHQQGVQT